jgi:hypothetical protein
LINQLCPQISQDYRAMMIVLWALCQTQVKKNLQPDRDFQNTVPRLYRLNCLTAYTCYVLKNEHL